MSTYKNLMTVCCAAVLALGLAACGSSSDDDKDMGMNGDGDTTPMAPPAAPTPMPVSMNLELSDAEQAALRGVLPETGDSDMLTYRGRHAARPGRASNSPARATMPAR